MGACVSSQPGTGLHGSPQTLSKTKPKLGTPLLLTKKQLLLATNSFASWGRLGEGSEGEVFKGKLFVENATEEGAEMDVAVKRMRSGQQEYHEHLINQLVGLSRLQSPHIAPLIGHCSHQDGPSKPKEYYVVYPFYGRMSLKDALHTGEEVLTWQQRINILLDAATGLQCLHKNKIIHRNLKPSNILLDQNYRACICDMSAAKAVSSERMSTQVVGTLGYLDPDYVLSGRVTYKADVFSFGAIIFEIVAGPRFISPDGNLRLPEYTEKVAKSPTSLMSIVDPDIRDEVPDDVHKLLRAARLCVLPNLTSRPDVDQLVKFLTILTSRSNRASSEGDRISLTIPSDGVSQVDSNADVFSRGGRLKAPGDK